MGATRVSKIIHLAVWLSVAIGLAAVRPLPSSCAFAQDLSTPQNSFAAVDERALTAPASAQTSVESLVKYLTTDAKSDIEKTRAIFRWVTANIDFDPSMLQSRTTQKVDANEILRQKKTICMGYSEIFYILGQAAGLEVQRIAGFARGYNPSGGTICNSSPNHEWNAVKIDGKWMLLDCTWGTGHMEPGMKFVKRYEEFYFGTPPEQFIFDHYPVDPEWQFLPKSISCKEWEQLTLLKSPFFRYGFDLDSHRRMDIQTTEPVEISLIARQDVVVLAQLTCGQEQIPRAYTFVEKDGNKVRVAASFPHPGDYSLKLFAKPETSAGSCDWVAEYRIEVPSLSKPAQCFPESLTAFLERDAKLVSPKCGKLEPGTPQQFRLSVPGAKVVAVIAGKKWSYLQKAGDVFEGMVDVTNEPMQVCVNFGTAREYQVLLTYNKGVPPPVDAAVAGTQSETGKPSQNH